MLKQEILGWMPDHIRRQQFDKFKNQKIIKFPAAYFPKTKGYRHFMWDTLCPLDNQGMVIKTAPDFLIDELLKTLKKYNQPFDEITL